MSTLKCWNCGAAQVELVLPVSRRADCPSCRAELHCCRQCRHYAPGRSEQCAEDRAEPPSNKEVANVCEWFEPLGGLAGVERAEDRARANLDALFGGSDAGASDDGAPEAGAPRDVAAQDDPAQDDPAASARRRLDDLFD